MIPFRLMPDRRRRDAEEKSSALVHTYRPIIVRCHMLGCDRSHHNSGQGGDLVGYGVGGVGGAGCGGGYGGGYGGMGGAAFALVIFVLLVIILRAGAIV